MSRACSFSFGPSVVAALVCLAGCAVGPDFSPPLAPSVQVYDSHALTETTADGAQRLVSGRDIPSEWWALFHSEKLNQLVEMAIRDNPDLASAEAALRVAEASLTVGEAAYSPVVRGGVSSARQQVSKYAGARSIYTLHSASVGVSYNLDLWGGTRRSVEHLLAKAEMARFQREAAYLALTSNVVALAITEASLREQMALAREIVESNEKMLATVKLRFDVGAVAKNVVIAQEAALASARTALPPLQHQLVVTRHALSALVGRMPAEALGAEFRLAEMSLPEEVPLSFPSKLVQQRPDIRAAQENLRAASAAIGVAVASRLPNVILSADLGSMANVLSQFFSPGGGFWGIGASATQALFDGGALEGKEKAARESFAVASAQYRKTVLSAFQNVADTLHALQSDAESLILTRDAEKASSDNLALVKARFDAGAVGISELHFAQQAALQARMAYAQARAQRYVDTAALFAALGGGWWNRQATVDAVRPPLFEKGYL